VRLNVKSRKRNKGSCRGTTPEEKAGSDEADQGGDAEGRGVGWLDGAVDEKKPAALGSGGKKTRSLRSGSPWKKHCAPKFKPGMAVRMQKRMTGKDEQFDQDEMKKGVVVSVVNTMVTIQYAGEKGAHRRIDSNLEEW